MGTIYQQLPKILLVVISALIAYQAALLTWSLYPEEESAYIWNPPAKTSAKGAAKLNTKPLQQQYLFGEAKGGNAVAKSSKDVAPKTRLKLILVGIVAATDPKYSSVIIEHKGEQDSYFIDSIITGTKAKVSEIYSDRIIITVQGQKQTLILDGLEQDNQRMASIENGQETKTKRKSKRVKKESKTKEIALDREALLSNPGKLLDYIRISPVREGDEIKGYRVNPGKDPSIFKDSGLKAGDLAVELNGIDLTDMSQAMGLMKEFPTMTDISLTVDRDGELNELFFSIP